MAQYGRKGPPRHVMSLAIKYGCSKVCSSFCYRFLYNTNAGAGKITFVSLLMSESIKCRMNGFEL